MGNPAIQAIRRAVELAPDDMVLRVHLGQLLLAEGDVEGALAEAAVAIRDDTSHGAARALMQHALAAPAGDASTFDFGAAERELRGSADPGGPAARPDLGRAAHIDPERLTLEDVGGMAAVKERINAAFLAPLRNPELRAMFGKRLRGGLLMYGPPGCGKTYLARAIAGELDAAFFSVAVHDVLDAYLGSSERNLHEIFQEARRSTPCVLFVDELDTLGQRRGQAQGMMRGVVNQLLTELDGIDGGNDGLFVLAATNQPWDVDSALRRPGRFDRTVLVLPPDAEARSAIFTYHLRDRPLGEDIDIDRLTALTDTCSGADVAAICEAAAEAALLGAIRSGIVRPISMADLERATRETKPSTGAWLDTVRNLVQYGQDDGTFGELRTYLKRQRRL